MVEVGDMSRGPSVHSPSRVLKARRQSSTLGLRFSQYSNSCRRTYTHQPCFKVTFYVPCMCLDRTRIPDPVLKE